jgi:hypothetical protein
MSHRSRLTRRCLFSLPLAALPVRAAQTNELPASVTTPAGQAASALREVAFDPGQCWRVRELTLAREDIKLYFNDGYLILSKPVSGAPVAAMFWGDVEGGDAELLLLPPSAGERQSLARFAQTPNLNEHFKSAILLFTDGTGAEIAEFLREREPKPAPEMGALLAGQYSDTLRNLASSFETRVIQDVAGRVRPQEGLFFAAIAGSSLGTFDLIYDPQSTDQVVAAQLQSRENRSYYNIWTSFPSRRVRKDPALGPALREFTITDVRIDASLNADLHLTATVTQRIRIPETPGTRTERNALAFDISRRVRIREVTVDGAPAQLLQRETLRSTLLRGSENEAFLVAVPHSLTPGEHTVVFQQEGDVILPAGNGVYFVSARGTWYPHHGLQFANYELTFRCPKRLTLVSTGVLEEEREEGEFRVTRRRSPVPLRIAGFNLGEYKRSVAKRGELVVEVFANRAVESALTPQKREVMMPVPAPTTGRQPRLPAMQPVIIPQAAPDPASRIEELAGEVAEAFEFLSARFGPPPLKSLAVSPIPGTFGQGFPGLIYLSTLSYLPERDRPQFANRGIHQVFFSGILVAHEVAHQWWGNAVTTAGYRDEWIMESLANYSALLLLERKRGAKALEEVLDRYREHLLENGVSGQPIDSAGPIRLGARLETSETPEAYRAVVYEKGTWIIHMLRRRLGDAGFFAMLRDLNTRFLRGRVTTDDLRELAAARLPAGAPDRKLEQLFLTYVEGTGIPSLRLQTKQKAAGRGVQIHLELEQSGVDDEFSVDVPVEIDFGRGKVEQRWLRTDGVRTVADWTVLAAPVRIQLDPRNAVLAVKR